MAFFLIFDILCLLALFGMSVLVGLVIVAWGRVNIQLKNDLTFEERCISYDEKICICGGGSSGMKSWTLSKPTFSKSSTKRTGDIVLITIVYPQYPQYPHNSISSISSIKYILNKLDKFKTQSVCYL